MDKNVIYLHFESLLVWTKELWSKSIFKVTRAQNILSGPALCYPSDSADHMEIPWICQWLQLWARTSSMVPPHQDNIGCLGYKSPGHFHFRGALWLMWRPNWESGPLWACMLEGIFLVSWIANNQSWNWFLLKRLPGQIVFYLGLMMSHFSSLCKHSN